MMEMTTVRIRDGWVTDAKCQSCNAIWVLGGSSAASASSSVEIALAFFKHRRMIGSDGKPRCHSCAKRKR